MNLFFYTGKRLFLCFLLVISGLINGTAQNRSQEIVKLLTDEALKEATVGFEVRDPKTDSIIFQYNNYKSLTPASIQKLITTSVALEILGPQTRFSTTLYYRGKIERGVLKGDIVIKGSGDPTLGSQLFDETSKKDIIKRWRDSIKAIGITRIEGSVIADASIFDIYANPPTWTWQDMGNYYGAGVYGVAIYDNAFDMVFNSKLLDAGDKATLLRTFPDVPLFNIQSDLTAADIDADNSYVYSMPYDNDVMVTGQIPKGKSEYPVRGAMPNPPLCAAWLLTKALNKAEVTITGMPSVVSRKMVDSTDIMLQCIAEIQSPTVADIVYKTNQNSVNLFAEYLLKHVGLRMRGKASLYSGVVAIENYLKANNAVLEGINIMDGCGLSRMNTITPHFMTSLLCDYYRCSPYFNEFYRSLPVSGESGTLASFGKHKPLKGRINAKTGTMTRVKSLCGFITTQSGKLLCFSFTVNNQSCSAGKLKSIMEDVFEIVYKR